MIIRFIFLSYMLTLLGSGCSEEQSRSVINLRSGDHTAGTNQLEAITSSAARTLGEVDLVDSSYLQMAVTAPQERVLPSKVLVRGIASFFNTDHLWQPPRQCHEIANSYDVCGNAAERVYCNDVLSRLNLLYCQLGGESRTTASYLGRSLTSGDLVVIWRFASDVCSLRKAPNPNNPSQRIDESAIADRIGLAVNQEMGNMAEKLIEKFLGLNPGDSQWDSERRFILYDLLKADSAEDVFEASAAGRRQLWQRVSAACMYLTVHSQQMTY